MKKVGRCGLATTQQHQPIRSLIYTCYWRGTKQELRYLLDRTLPNRDYQRAWLPHTLAPGETAQIDMSITPPEAPGRYALKFDLVSEGIDWFEACGSPTTMKRMVVV